MNEQDLKDLAEASVRTHHALNNFNTAERLARKAKQEYERLQAEQWRITERILGGKP